MKWLRNKNISYLLPVLLVLIFAALMTIPLKAKAVVIPGVSSDSMGYTAVLYNSETGLPTSEANAVVQTKDGFLWIGSYSGLIRYDGNEFYRFEATTGITSVACLFVDSKDRLWIGTNDKGVFLYQNGEFTVYGKEQGLASGSVKKIAEDTNGNLYIATTCGLVLIDSLGQVRLIDDERISEQYLCDLAGNQKNEIVGVTLNGDVFLVSDSVLVRFYENGSLTDAKIKSVCFDMKDERSVYLGTEENVIVHLSFDDQTDTHTILTLDDLSCINRMHFLPTGELFVCTDNGIGYFNASGTKFFVIPGLAMNNSIDDMMVDYEGNLWFASSRQGIMKIVPNRFRNISRDAGLSDMVVNTTCIYQNELYIGSDSGLSILDKENQVIQNSLTALLDGIRIRCIKTDTKGNLWLCTYGEYGLVRYNGDGVLQYYTTENGLNSNRVRSITEAADGSMIVAGNNGINIIRNYQVTESYDAKDGLVNTEILSVCEGPEGVLYAGSDGGGIYVIQNGEVSCICEEDGIESGVILRIRKDPDKELYWIITGNSIAVMENGAITTLHNFPYSNNFDIFFSEEGMVWVLSENGIYVTEKEALLSGSTFSYQFYNYENGMPSNATANSWSFLEDDQTLYIAGTANVFSTNVNSIQENEHTLKLAVPFIQTDDQIIYRQGSDELVIPSSCKRLSIYGFVLTGSLQDPVVSYRLEGFDEMDTRTTKSELGTISYTNLKGGTYTFVLSVYNEDGSLNNELHIPIRKTQTFWESSWFFIVATVLILIAGLVAGMIAVRIRNKVLETKHRRAKKLIQQVIGAFAKAIDGKDKYTNGHSFRVAEYSLLIAQELGYDEEKSEDIYNIALLHDIGKIAVPDAILNKSAGLTEEEFYMMKRHPASGYDILSEISIFPEMSLGARYHHEKVDGTGYPLGLKGDEIPEIAKIIAVADTFDAMYSTRPYRKKLSIEYVADELDRVAGIQLDKKVVDAMIKLIREKKIHAEDVR